MGAVGSMFIQDSGGYRYYGYDANNNLTSVGGERPHQLLDLRCLRPCVQLPGRRREPDPVPLRRQRERDEYRLSRQSNVFYAFDSLNRLTNVTDWAGRQTTLTYDLASRLTSITRPNRTVRQMNYDADGEATNIVEKTTTGFPIAFFTLGWTNSGRVAWEFAAPLPHSSTPPSRTMTYDDDNRLATVSGQSVTNDALSNLSWGPLTNSTFVSYGCNLRNQLLNAGGLTTATTRRETASPSPTARTIHGLSSTPTRCSRRCS